MRNGSVAIAATGNSHTGFGNFAPQSIRSALRQMSSLNSRFGGKPSGNNTDASMSDPAAMIPLCMTNSPASASFR